MGPMQGSYFEIFCLVVYTVQFLTLDLYLSVSLFKGQICWLTLLNFQKCVTEDKWFFLFSTQGF
jgi:hypothetical protein